jgi:hypothetical protein
MPPKIESYRFGQIQIDGERFIKDVIIFPERVRARWWRVEGHNLMPVDLEEVFAETADTLIIGQGAYGRMKVPEETRARIMREGLELYVMGTKEAVELYNQRRDQESVIAALHLTC